MTDSKAKTLKEAYQWFNSVREDLSSLCLFWSIMYSRDIVDCLISWAFSTADLYEGCLTGYVRVPCISTLQVHLRVLDLESPCD